MNVNPTQDPIFLVRSHGPYRAVDKFSVHLPGRHDAPALKPNVLKLLQRAIFSRIS